MSSTEALSGDALSATSGAETGGESDVFMSDSDFQGSSSAAGGALSGSAISEQDVSDAQISELDSEMEDAGDWAEDAAETATSGIESSITVVVEDQEPTEEKIDVQAGMSFGDILRELQKKGHDVEDDWALYDEKENELDRDDFASGYIGQTIFAKWQSFEVIVKDCMCTNPTNKDQDGILVQASQNWTGQMLAEYVFVQTNERPVLLTHEGRVIFGKGMGDDQKEQEEAEKKTLADFGIKYDPSRQQDIIILGRMKVIIRDSDCELRTEVLCLPNYGVKDLIKTYCDSVRREQHETAELSLNGNTLDIEGQTLFDAEIMPNTELYYKVPEYDVLIADSDESQVDGDDDKNFVTIKVWDFWTVKEIKSAYEQMTQKPFMPGDRILIETGGNVHAAGQPLEDGMKLFKLRIKNREKLNIEREEQAIAFMYQCANCGAFVKLKRADAVQCRECFHRILFKCRTRRVCQYNCR